MQPTYPETFMTALASSTSHADLPADTTGNSSSGPSPTLHLLGLGKVGQAVLEQLEGSPTLLLAATDSSATRHDRRGLVPSELLRAKRSKIPLVAFPGAEQLPLHLVLGLSRAEIVVDALPSTPLGGLAALERCRAVLRSGKKLVLASKDALAVGAESLLGEANVGRIGIQAALGGTGQALLAELGDLRAKCEEIAIVANASTTELILALEQGLALEEGIARCQARGVLESDPTLDLDGTDAATKLAIVARAVFGLPVHAAAVPRQDARGLDPALVRARRLVGASTRLVGRATRDGRVQVSYEELPLGSVLRVPSDRVVYTYRRRDGTTRVHVGHAIGAKATATALLVDVCALSGGAL